MNLLIRRLFRKKGRCAKRETLHNTLVTPLDKMYTLAFGDNKSLVCVCHLALYQPFFAPKPLGKVLRKNTANYFVFFVRTDRSGYAHPKEHLFFLYFPRQTTSLITTHCSKAFEKWVKCLFAFATLRSNHFLLQSLSAKCFPRHSVN